MGRVRAENNGVEARVLCHKVGVTMMVRELVKKGYDKNLVWHEEHFGRPQRVTFDVVKRGGNLHVDGYSTSPFGWTGCGFFAEHFGLKQARQYVRAVKAAARKAIKRVEAFQAGKCS